MEPEEKPEQPVELKKHNLEEIFNLTLRIPDYQRIYCWREKNVIQLLDDVSNLEKDYHLGSIILQKTGEKEYNIVDGQQRLVTLAIILQKIGKDDVGLLNEKFESEEAQNYVAYNKHLINNYNDKYAEYLKKENLLKYLQFSVLIINNVSLDLAYTFFSNQNSRGKSLTDYDLLKAHHLRFIHIEEQAKHLADRWDNIIQNNNNLSRTFCNYLFRLRKWMRKKEWNENEKFKVKTEFEAMPTIPDIPPFGEKFHFYESIQGGTHFFAYADHFIYKYKTFSETAEYKALQNLDGESHWWYRDVIESLLFAYYLKFGTMYLGEALVCIEKLISRHRYEQSRSSIKYVLKQGSDTEIVMMIDQATSPTFFLAEALKVINRMPKITDKQKEGIRGRYFDRINSIYTDIENSIAVQSIKNIIPSKK